VFRLYHQFCSCSKHDHPPNCIPGPPGPYVPSLEIKTLVDSSRPDSCNTTLKFNRLLTSIFTPIPKSHCFKLCNVTYMAPAVAATFGTSFSLPGLFQRFQLGGICCNASAWHSSNQTISNNTYPLIIILPGYGESRLEFSAVAQYISGFGYRVITVDEPGEPKVVQFTEQPHRGQLHSTFALRTYSLSLNNSTKSIYPTPR
jgi:hypothetical protein